MPADWHTRDEVLSSETTASEKPGSTDKQVSLRLLFHSRNYSQFVKRSSKPDNVAFEKKITMGSHHLIRCAFPDKGRKKNR